MPERKQHILHYKPTIEAIIRWCEGFDKALVLCSNNEKSGQKDPYGRFDVIAAVGSVLDFENTDDTFEALLRFQRNSSDWIFGHLSYELKDPIHGLHTINPEGIGFKAVGFFVPRYILIIKDEEAVIHFKEGSEDQESLNKINEQLSHTRIPARSKANKKTTSTLTHRTSHASYLDKAKSLLNHIQRGDIYEINFCVESFIENCNIDPSDTFLRLQDFSPMPFSAFYRCDSRFLMCASPERYLAKRGDDLISQPIKGTIRRGKNDTEDSFLKEKLRNDPKEQSENIMITDLVRNDLARVAARNSVHVQELMGLKTFPRIHQLISTVTARLGDGIPWTEAIRNTFPMGSMTGAPKLRALQLIDEYEDSPRGLYSGCVGYVTPEEDFDFNVVIRSIQYNAASGYLSMMAGSALTIGCDPEQEYHECLLKAETMVKALE
ncbi:MAG: chorismate-binding protein [Bacteroidota bacterium]